MAANFARSLLTRLRALDCPYIEGVDESWIVELITKPGEPRIQLLQWLFSKFDSKIGELLDSQTTILESKMDSRIQSFTHHKTCCQSSTENNGLSSINTNTNLTLIRPRTVVLLVDQHAVELLFVASNLGLCRYDDVDLIRIPDRIVFMVPSIFMLMGVKTTLSRQAAFFDHLLDVVMICEFAEDPMTKSMLNPGILSDASPLEEQLTLDCRYIDTLASLQLTDTMLTPNISLLPSEVKPSKQDSKDSPQEQPNLQSLAESYTAVEQNLLRQLEVLADLQKMTADTKSGGNSLQHASCALDIVLRELCQLVLSFTYCYENEMQPWCHKSQPDFLQLGPAFKRVYNLLQQFAQMLTDLLHIHQLYNHLNQDIKQKLKTTDSRQAKVSLTTTQNTQACLDILETSMQRQNLTLSTSLCSSILKT